MPPDTPATHLGQSEDRWADSRKVIADMQRVRGVPDSDRPDGVVSAPEFSGHKSIYLANLEGCLGGRFPALLAERDRRHAALEAARGLLHEFALKRGSTDGLGAIFEVLNDGLRDV